MPQDVTPFPLYRMLVHDCIFNIFMSQGEIALQLIRTFAPPHLLKVMDFSIFQSAPTAHADEQSGTTLSDMVYQSRLKGKDVADVFFLIEHKSYIPEHPIQLQLVGYIYHIWRNGLINNRGLDFIVPVVLYHGEAAWPNQTLAAHIKGLTKQQYNFVVHFDYLFINLRDTSEETLAKKVSSALLLSWLLALKFARDLEGLTRNLPRIVASMDGEALDAGKQLLWRSLVWYIKKLYSMGDKEQVLKILERAPKDAQEAYEMILEDHRLSMDAEVVEKAWREGLEEGLEEGLRKGIEEHTRMAVLNLLRRYPSWSDSEIAELMGTSEEFVCALREQLAQEVDKANDPEKP